MAEVPQSPETLVRSFYAFLGGDPAVRAEDVVTADWEDIPVAPGFPPGPDGLRATAAFLIEAFGPLDVEIADVVASGDRVAVRTVSRGVHRGDFLGVAATGRDIAFASCDIHHLRDGKLERSWHLEDLHGLFAQLRGDEEG